MCRCVKKVGVVYPDGKSVERGCLKKKIVYLSGPMTGLTKNNFPEFKRVEKALCRMGFKVLNPAISFPNGNYADCMRRSLAMLLQADMVCKLNGWEKSRGAKLELEIARALDMKIFVYVAAGEKIDIEKIKPPKIRSGYKFK